MFYKYPKTMHLPWSPGLQNDDRLIESLDAFVGQRVIITEKMDGENATLYRNHYHARSLDSRHHPSRDWIKSFHGGIRYLIPEGYRICGENLYARHSVKYDNLESYFYGFSVWDENNICLDWDSTLDIFDKCGILSVPLINDIIWNEDFINNIKINGDLQEGYVVRLASSFHFDDFHKSVAKYVRKGHIQTDQHWMHGQIIPNGIRKD